MSDHCLEYLINEPSFISNSHDCLEVLKNRDIYYQNISTIHNKCRQCKQNMFNILISGGLDYEERKPVNQVKLLIMSNLRKCKDPPLMLEKRYCSQAVCLKGETYVFGRLGPAQKSLLSVVKNR